MFLYGYGPQILDGLLVTLQLSLSSLLLAFALGLCSAKASLAKGWLWRGTANCYTTFIRGMPDLVTMLMLFYGLQMSLNHLTEYLDWQQITINPFAAGVMTLGFIYGAYFSETISRRIFGCAQRPIRSRVCFRHEQPASVYAHFISANDAFCPAGDWQQLAGTAEKHGARVNYRLE